MFCQKRAIVRPTLNTSDLFDRGAHCQENLAPRFEASSAVAPPTSPVGPKTMALEYFGDGTVAGDKANMEDCELEGHDALYSSDTVVVRARDPFGEFKLS